MRFGFLNNFASQIAAPLNDTATELELSEGAELLEATLSSADAVALTLFATDSQGNETKREVVYVTAVTGTTVTIERGQEGVEPQTFSAGDGVEARLTAGMLSNFYSGSAWGEDAATLGSGATATAAAGVAIGAAWGGDEAAGSYEAGGVAIGSGAGAYGVTSLALVGASAYGARSIALGRGATVYGDDGVSIYGEVNATRAVAIGKGASATAEDSAALLFGASATSLRALAVGYNAEAGAIDAVSFGRETMTYGEASIAFGVKAASYARAAIALGESSEASFGGGIALGKGAEAAEKNSIALGEASKVQITGGMQINALSYVPLVYDHTSDTGWGNAPENSTRQSAMQVVIATAPLDLTGVSGAVATIELPANTVLLPDAFDIVIVEASGAGGSPEVQIGPDDVTPDSYLAATPVGKTAVGGRKSHMPLTQDGITSLRVSVVTAGTGTLKAKLVVRGYVMEI